MLTSQTKNPDVKKIIEKYGQGFDVIYFDGRFDENLKLPTIYSVKDLMRRS